MNLFFDNIWLMAAVWVGLALTAALVSIRLGISVALAEIMAGVLAGNLLGLVEVPWMTFLAGLGVIFLTFLAGAEVDPGTLRNKFKESLAIGFFSFLVPLLGGFAFTHYLLAWDFNASLLSGIALSSTSVAVVYAVTLETGLNRTELGKVLLAACFFTNLGTVTALGVAFAGCDIWMAIFVAVAAGVLAVMPRLTPWFVERYGGRITQLEIKFFFFFLLLLGGLALQAGSEAVLPAYLLGLTTAGYLLTHRDLLRQLRAVAFTFFIPFYFLKAGLLISLPAVAASLALIGMLLAVKLVAKFAGVWPLTGIFRYGRREGLYTTLLMSTGLTFGIIAAMFGLDQGLINQEQYTVLVAVEIASAIVPTLIAQAYLRPRVGSEMESVTGD